MDKKKKKQKMQRNKVKNIPDFFANFQTYFHIRSTSVLKYMVKYYAKRI